MTGSPPSTTRRCADDDPDQSPSQTPTRLSDRRGARPLLKEPLPVRFTAYDGSATGPDDSAYRLHLATERGLTYLLTAPGDLGFSRAYVAGDLELHGAHPGDPYELLKRVQSRLSFRRPSPAEAVTLLRSLGLGHLQARRRRRRRRRRPGCAAPSRGSGTRWAATPRRSTTTTTSPTSSTSTCSGRR